jgi:hypothetical protein
MVKPVISKDTVKTIKARRRLVWQTVKRCLSVLLYSLLVLLGFIAFGNVVVSNWIYYVDLLLLGGVILVLVLLLIKAYRIRKLANDFQTSSTVGNVLQGVLLLFLILVISAIGRHWGKPQSETTYLSITPNHARKIYTVVLASYCFVCFLAGLYSIHTTKKTPKLDTQRLDCAWYNPFLYMITQFNTSAPTLSDNQKLMNKYDKI